jgi:hypothetical protein
MAILELQTLTDGTPHYTFRTQLEGTDYQFTFRFGTRRGVWVFDLATVDGDDIVVGQVVTIGRDLLKRSASAFKPPGLLWAWNISRQESGGAFELPGLTDLGPDGRCRLYYTESTTAAENAELGEVNPLTDE